MEITLPDGTVTQLDTEDFIKYGHISWSRSGRYVQNTLLGALHRLIVQPSEGYIVDHIDGNTFNNHRANLRIVSHHQNRLNSKDVKARKLPPYVYTQKSGRFFGKFTRNGVLIKTTTYNTVEEVVNELMRIGAY